LADRDGDVAFGGLARRAEDAFVFGVGQADPHHTVEHRRHGRHRSPGSHGGGAALQRLAVVRRRQPEVREDRRLERHDRPPLVEGVSDVVGTDRCQHHARLRLHRPPR
jgi:hypothetical protein